MELRQISYVLAVADELHFSRAADRLHVAQPSLSRSVRALEREIGVDLFDRTSRRVALTAAGAAFVEAARHVDAAAADLPRVAVDAAAGKTGRVRLGFVASGAESVLPRLASAHRRRRPGVDLVLMEMTTDEQVAALLSGAIDLGLCRDLGDESPDLGRTPLFREPLVAVVPAEHRLSRRRLVSMADLVTDDFVTLPRRGVPRSWQRLVAMAQEVGASVRVQQEATQFLTLLALVAAGVGVAVVPASVRALRAEGVRYVRLRDPLAYSDVLVVARAADPPPTAVDLRDLLVSLGGPPGTRTN